MDLKFNKIYVCYGQGCCPARMNEPARQHLLPLETGLDVTHEFIEQKI